MDDAAGIGWKPDEIDELVSKAAKAAQGAYDDATAPEEFRDYDEGQRKTHACPKCGFAVVCTE